MKTLLRYLRRALGSRADEFLGPDPEKCLEFQNALSRIADLPHNMNLSSSEIGHRAVVIAEETLKIRQVQAEQAAAPAGGKAS